MIVLDPGARRRAPVAKRDEARMLSSAHSFEILPATVHDLTAALPAGATVFVAKSLLSEADARSVLEAVGVHFVSAWRTNMTPNTWADDFDLRGPQAH